MNAEAELNRAVALSDEQLIAECERRHIAVARWTAAINPEDQPKLEFKFGDHWGHTPDACETCRQDAENARAIYFRTKHERDEARRALAEAQAREVALREALRSAVCRTPGCYAGQHLLEECEFAAVLAAPTDDASALREFGMRVARAARSDLPRFTDEGAVDAVLRGAR